MIKTLHEEVKSVMLLAPQVDAALTSDYVSLKNCSGRAQIKVVMAQANAAQCTITLGQASDVAGTGAKALTNNVNVLYNSDLSLTDQYTTTTAAKAYQFSATLKNKVVIFDIDPAYALDINNGFDCIYLTSGGSNAANILYAEINFPVKYKEDVLDSAITD